MAATGRRVEIRSTVAAQLAQIDPGPALRPVIKLWKSSDVTPDSRVSEAQPAGSVPDAEVAKWCVVRRVVH